MLELIAQYTYCLDLVADAVPAAVAVVAVAADVAVVVSGFVAAGVLVLVALA